MALDDLIRTALHDAERYEPSPDLFTRVQRSIEETAAHRRRVRRWTLGLGLGAAVIAWAFAAWIEVVDGVARMAWGRMEMLETTLLVGLVVLVGPALRRFGRTYVDDVLRASPAGGRSLLALLDIAFYLVLGAVILLGVELGAGRAARPLLGTQLADAAIRVGVVMAAMGVLHALTLFLLPFIGLVLTSGAWRANRAASGAEAAEPSGDVASIDRIAGRIAWVLAAAGGGVVLAAALVVFVLGVAG